MTRAFGLSLLTAAALAALPGAAHADPGTAQGSEGQKLTVSSTTVTDGQTVTVKGEGFDTAKGIYVAFCKDLGDGRAPTPCGGGADTSGLGGGSHWISDSPPPYGKDLAEKYGPGGSFEVQIKLVAKIGEDVDCAVDVCSVVTRADHTRAEDRTADVRIPLTFTTDGGGGSDTALYVGGGVAALVVVAGGGFLLARRRKAAA
ncbi:hypothetical protein [Actinocorallia sp. A-T 12471]|uniref:hypothetical protein n=1 Tax=Actinocorallia sp. A-T 12471 TaxID=3089813 RepID=UPI0029D19953|nr:hypothetical protein [Actinocorallia sp. A-T 12471]MDX6740278.1 hypothetical protein [Actinocorallia sp. A-T 12471]